MNGQVSTLNMSVLTGYGILDREFRKELGMTAPNFSDFSVFRQMKLVNKLKPEEMTNRHEFYHYEKTDHLKANATITAIGTSVANQVTITLAAEDHYDSGAKSYPIVTNDVVFSNQVVGLVYSVDRSVAGAHTVTIKSLTGSNDVQSAAVIGSIVNFVGNSQQEASGATEMRVPSFTKITQNLKTTRGHFKYTDHAGQNQVEFITGPDGNKYIHPLGISDTAQQFEMDEEFSMLTGKKNTATVTNAAGNSITTSQGLIPEIYANGMTGEYFGDVDMSSYDDWLLQIIANYGDGEYMCMAGIQLGLNVKNWAIDFAKNEAAYAWFDGGKEQAATFNFTGIKMPGVGFDVYFKDLKAFSHAGTLGHENLPYQKMGLMIPCGNALNPKTNTMQPYLQIRYAKPGGAAHEIQGDIKVFYTGGNSRNGATSDVLEEGFHIVSYKALQMFNIKKFMVIEKAG